MPTIEELLKDDMRIYGVAVARRYADGTVERVDPTEVIYIGQIPCSCGPGDCNKRILAHNEYCTDDRAEWDSKMANLPDCRPSYCKTRLFDAPIGASYKQTTWEGTDCYDPQTKPTSVPEDEAVTEAHWSQLRAHRPHGDAAVHVRLHGDGLRGDCARAVDAGQF